jgi:hypothetical protein
MHSSRKQMPLEFGRPPRNIWKHYNGFKATEWSNWITMYSLPFLDKKSCDYIYIYLFIYKLINQNL